MKKIISFLAILAFAVLILSGCGSNGAKATLNKATDNFNKVKSYNFTGKDDTKITGSQADQGAQTLNFNGSFKAPNEYYTKNETDYMGQKLALEVYQKNNEYYYNNSGSSWQKVDSKDIESLKNSIPDTNPAPLLKDIKDNQSQISYSKDETVNGVKYKVIKVVIKTNKLLADEKKAAQDSLNEIIKSAKPENKSYVDQQKQQTNEYIKNLKLTQSYKVYVDASGNIVRIIKDKEISTVINKSKVAMTENFTMDLKDYNKEVKMPDVTKK